MAESCCNLSEYRPINGNLIEEIEDILNIQMDLKSLYLSGNSLIKTPLKIQEFVSLTHLDLSFNELDDFEINDAQLLDLIHLDLRSNRIATLPSCLLGFKSLQSLLINTNNLVNIGCLPVSLVALDLSRNYITTLPEHFFKRLENVKTINLSFNDLTELPDVVGINLETLNCQNNKLCKFPNILQSTGLKFLDLSSNLISTMEDDCFDFQHNLIKLLLNENPITHLPDLSDLMSLTVLDISSTNITNLPTSLASLALLTTLYVVPPYKSIQNPLDLGRKSDFEKFVYPPGDVVGKGLKEIQKYLQATAEEKRMVTANLETLDGTDKPVPVRKGNLDEFDCLVEELVVVVKERDSDQIEALQSLVTISINDLLRPHIMYVFLNAGLKGGSPILGKFIIRVEKILSRFERTEITYLFKSTTNFIFRIVETHLLNAMLMKPHLAQDQNLNLITDVIRVWSLFAWEHYSIQTMKLVQDLIIIGKSIPLNTKIKAQSGLTRRQVKKWCSFFEGFDPALLELEYLNGSNDLYMKVG